LKTNTCRAKNSCYLPKRVVRTNLSKVHLTLIRVKSCKVYVTLIIKVNVTLEIIENKLTKSNSKV